MINRRSYRELILERLKRNPIVSVLGARQVGKTTLARQLTEDFEIAHFFDLENPIDAQRLTEPMTTLEHLRGLIVLDEVQCQPDLFPILRVLADRKPLPARFLLLGSASPWLVRGVSESLAGRVAFVDLHGFDLQEIGPDHWRRLWWQGGYPRSYLAENHDEAREWQNGLICTMLERDLPQLGITIPAATLRRFWNMIAHFHGQTWNAAEFARALGASEATARRYLDILTSMFLVRQMPPWFENLKKRQVKSPKIYVRDTGLLHAFLNITTPMALEGHIKIGASWEGFVIEQISTLIGEAPLWYWGTYSGAELDAFTEINGRRLGFECKYADAPTVTKSMHSAHEDLKLERLLIVTPGTRSYPLADWAEVVGIVDLVPRLRHLLSEMSL